MKILNKNLINCLFIILIFTPILSFSNTTENQLPSLENMTVNDYLKLYYSDNPNALMRLKNLNEDATSFIIAADIYSREIQDKPLFCSDNKNDAITLTPEIFSELMIDNLSKLNVHQDIVSIKKLLPFTYYALGVMAETYPCQGVKKPFDLFGKIQLSYLEAKNKY
ncbi:hypothetical protein L3V83_08210 [Thiotrichales bacterium 19X7-9]|nr:hypothetical protein [Thiotrichales bacterium 19X7-9]